MHLEFEKVFLRLNFEKSKNDDVLKRVFLFRIKIVKKEATLTNMS